MTRSIGYKEFNPFTDTLAEGDRLRLLDGKLTVESSDFRKKEMNGWERFWTRSEYSQSGILEEMNRLYQKQIGKDVNREIFTENFKSLEGRATAQNEEFKDVNPIVRFFEAKRFIDVAAFHKKFEKTDAAIVKAVEDKQMAEAQVAQRRAQQEAADQEALRREQERQAQIEAQKQAARDKIQAEHDARIKPFQDHIATFTKDIEEIENLSLEDCKKYLYDLFIIRGTTSENAQKAVDQYQSVDDAISNLRSRISLAEKAIEASEATKATQLTIQDL